MLTKVATEGALAACARFGIDAEKLAAAAPASLLSSVIPKAKAFGQNQWGAAKDLFNNARGGLGGQLSPDFKGSLDPSHAELGRAAHRSQAVGNLKTLAPSLAVAGGGALLYHQQQKKQKEQEMLQQQQGRF